MKYTGNEDREEKDMRKTMMKLCALLAALVMLLSCAAMAEETAAAEENYSYEGVWIQFPNDGFEMYLPANWLMLEVNETLLDAGIYFGILDPDNNAILNVAWNSLPESMTLEAMREDLAVYYPEAQVVTLGSNQVVEYLIAEQDLLTFAFPDQTEAGMFMITVMPASDVAINLMAHEIVSSMRALPVQDAEAE